MALDTSEPVPGFRLYRAKLVDGAGRTDTTVEIIASNDDEAIRQVQGLSLSYTVEVWDKNRLVATVPLRRR